MLDYKSCNDFELLELLREDDHAAFTEIYDRYWSVIYTASYRALNHRQDCMDVCQGIFLWLWENRLTIKVKTTLQGYLYTAVKYKIANLIRNGKVRETLLEDILTSDVRSDEARELEVKELKYFITQLIQELPEKCREVFLLSRDEHLSHKQISQKLGISEKTVNDHITRALKKLREPLSRMATIFLSL